ncbi:hypothetical protein H0H93_001766 [Arthromyces matolae]|nr:hypothetical protein H0H93_001766 [Arthromyces matolae]
MPSNNPHGPHPYHLDLNFRAALLQARQLTLEGPWYGLYNHILTRVIFPNICRIQDVTSETYPQYPLTHVDSGSHDYGKYEDVPDDISEPGSTPDRDDISRFNNDSSPGQMLTYSSRANSAQPQTPQGLQTPQTPSPSRPRKLRSTRIPDFAQIQHRLRQRGNPPQEYLESRFLMLAEIKKQPSRRQQTTEGFLRYIFQQTVDQATQQACHAFVHSPEGANFKSVNVIGSFIAVGHYWNYVEFERGRMDFVKGLSDTPQSQRSYAPTISSSDEGMYAAASHTEPLVHFYLPDCPFFLIDTDSSDQALRWVRNRMKDLAN